MPKNDTAETLRRRIALYHQYLAEGVEAEIAAEYLKTILSDQAMLARLEGKAPKR